MKDQQQSYQYKTIEGEVESLFKDRGSKFFGYVFPAADKPQALEQLEAVREAHKKARHHCFAWRIGGQGQDYRIADDGEPAGSAGQPIFNQLLSHEITHVNAIVVRYFGGTKLGVPGLINAYKTSIYDALSQAKFITKSLSAFYSISTPYEQAARLLNVFKEKNCEIVDVEYLETVNFRLSVPAKAHEQTIRHALTVGFQLQALEMLDELIDKEIIIELTNIEQ